jgi:hypothetical protein
MSDLIYLQRGVIKSIPFRALNGSGGVLDITSSTITVNVKKDNFDGADVFSKSTSVSGEIDILLGTSGIYQINLVNSDTIDLTGSDYYFIITIDGSTNKQGYFRILQESNASDSTPSTVYCWKPNIELTGTIDGNNKTFTFPNAIKEGSQRIYFGSLAINPIYDYTIVGQVVTLNFAPISNKERITADAEEIV